MGEGWRQALGRLDVAWEKDRCKFGFLELDEGRKTALWGKPW